jgi:SAM-dependent methyltransferase
MKPAPSSLLVLERPPEPPFDRLDFTAREVVCPGYSEEFERAIKRNEYYWLPRMFDLPRRGTVLDFGCGFGRSLEWLRFLFERCIGVDISETAVHMAAERFAGIEGIEFMVGPGDGLPRQIADTSVDLVYAFSVLEHIPRPFALANLRAFARVLRPGGCAIFNLLSGINEDADNGTPGTEWRIGYSAMAAAEMIGDAGLRVINRVRWSLADSPACWLWYQVST